MRLSFSSQSKFYRFFLLSFPFWLTLFLIILSLLPWKVAFIVHFAVPLAYISMFYWIIFKTNLMSPFVVFLLGLCADLLTNVHLGYNTFLFLLFYEIIFKNRYFLFGRSFVFLWCCFGVCCVGLAVAQWILASLLFLSWLPLSFFIGQEFLLFLMFPFVIVMCSYCMTNFLEEV